MERNYSTIEGKFIGDRKRGHDIGIHGSDMYIWMPCEKCQKLRWVRLNKGLPRGKLCQSCSLKGRKHLWMDNSGKKHPNWKGGRGYMHSGGYWFTWLPKDDFFYPMVGNGIYVAEHRLVMAKHLGRCLHSWEIVHHRNGNKLDNRIENLQLVTEGQHKQITLMEKRIKTLEYRVTILEAENILLRTKDKVGF